MLISDERVVDDNDKVCILCADSVRSHTGTVWTALRDDSTPAD